MAVLVAALVPVVGAPNAARASCAAPTDFVWSYPADGDLDVPLDADLLFVERGDWTGAVVSLDDEPLRAVKDVPGHYDLGRLKAHTKYRIAVTLADASNQGTPEPLSFSFTTGAGRAGGSDSSTLRVKSSSAHTLRSDEQLTCGDVLSANKCFDTGQPELARFVVETDAHVELWVFELVTKSSHGMVFDSFPADCGEPQLFPHDWPYGEAPSYRIHGVLRDGTVITSQVVPAPPLWDAGAGCATAGPAHATGFVLLALLPWLRAARRRR
jgi:hypothetical protein